jgi:NADPH-dependent 2,4-dienoyl-CoA reductase/sulfur reductase-like enzyme
MSSYDYLIVGGGMAAAAAVRGIRSLDHSAGIGLLSAEGDPPYRRPPLSKGLWSGEKEADLPLPVDGAELLLSRRALRIDLASREVEDDRGERHGFRKLLLATGGRPRRLPELEGALLYRDLADYRALRRALEAGVQSVAIVGAGFVGSELAAALTRAGKQVDLITAGQGIGDRIFPPGLVEALGRFYAEQGVRLHAETSVKAQEHSSSGQQLLLTDGQRLNVDLVVCAVGIQPNSELAASAGLPVGDGILVDPFGQVGEQPVYAAGDVANFFSPFLSKRVRVEHENHADLHGELVGRNLAGAGEPYLEIPFFYSDLFELGYEAVGELNAGLRVVEDWKEPYREGVVYYLQGERLSGVLLFGVWEKVEQARGLIRSGRPFLPDELPGQI